MDKSFQAIEGIVVSLVGLIFFGLLFVPEELLALVKAIRGGGKCKKQHHESCPMCGFKFQDR